MNKSKNRFEGMTSDEVGQELLNELRQERYKQHSDLQYSIQSRDDSIGCFFVLILLGFGLILLLGSLSII